MQIEILLSSLILMVSELSATSTEPEICCPEENITTDYGTFTFPSTQATPEGVLVQAVCPHGFADDGTEPMDGTDNNDKVARIKRSGSKRACVLQLDTFSGNSIGKWIPEKNILVKSCRTYNAFQTSSEIHNKIIAASNITPNTFRQILSKLLTLQVNALYDHVCAQTLIDSISRILTASELFGKGLEEEKKGLFGLIDSYTNEIVLRPGYKVKVENPNIAVEAARFAYANSSITEEGSITDYGMVLENVKVNIPADAIRMSLDQGVEGPKVKFTAYSEDLFLYWEEQQEPSSTTPGSTNDESVSTKSPPNNDVGNSTSNLIGNWRVFSVEMLGATIENLAKEFEYIIYPERGIDEFSFRCVYWNESEKSWSSSGMRSIQIGNAVICKSTHLTAFSVLIDPLPLPFPGSDYAPIQNTVHSHILAILSSLGSAFSIVGLAGTVLTYGLFRCLRRERSNRILLCLSISLLCMHLLSISSEKRLWDSKCFIPSALLHYFLHSSLWWMLCEAHHMHQLLISVFVKPESRFLSKRSVIAWGIPLIIVGTCAVVHPEVYTTGRNDLCVIAAHLNLPLYYIAYLSPVIAILLVNFFVFCRIFKVLYSQTLRQSREARVSKAVTESAKSNTGKGRWNESVGKKPIGKTTYVMLSPSQIKGAVTVMILVGVGWIVGLLAIGPFEIFFKYLFCICNAGQGAMIFVFRVILHPQACRQWRKAVLGFTVDAGEFSTTSSTNVSHRDRNLGSPSFISASNSVENSLTPSNPAAQDLAKTLANMLRNPENQVKPGEPL